MILFKLKFVLIVGGLGVLSFLSLLLFVAIFISDETDNANTSADDISSENMSATTVSEDVLTHQPIVEKYADQYDIPEYVPWLLALIEVESGGTVEDVMQSSESLGLPVNALDTEASIEQGTKYLSELLETATDKGVDNDTVLQAYNYGAGFIDYVAARGGSYSFELAEAFAKDQSDGEKTPYSNPVAVERNGGWRYNYGNMFYVANVSQYIGPSEGESSGNTEQISDGNFPEPDPADYGGIHPEGECTYYADNRRREIGAPLENARLGDAGSWVPKAEASGMETGTEPKVGAVMVYEYCQLNVSCRYGHVAVVEKLNDDGSVVVSEMNWDAHNVINFRTVSESDAAQLHYIY